MWPGYTMDVKQVTDGIFANVDTATKFIQMRTVLDGINDKIRDRWSKSDIISEYIPKDPEAKRLVVITMYNSRIYQIDGMTFEFSPKSLSLNWKSKNPQTGEYT